MIDPWFSAGRLGARLLVKEMMRLGLKEGAAEVREGIRSEPILGRMGIGSGQVDFALGEEELAVLLPNFDHVGGKAYLTDVGVRLVFHAGHE